MLAAQNDVYLVFHAMMQILRITLTDVVYISRNYQLNHTYPADSFYQSICDHNMQWLWYFHLDVKVG